MMDVSADYNQTGKTTDRLEDATDDYGVANARVGLGSSDGNWRAMAVNLTDEDWLSLGPHRWQRSLRAYLGHAPNLRRHQLRDSQ